MRRTVPIMALLADVPGTFADLKPRIDTNVDEASSFGLMEENV